MTAPVAHAEAAKRSIRERIQALGPAIKAAPPVGILAVLAGAALWPIAAPLLGTGTAVGVVGGVMGSLGGPGKAFISEFLTRMVARRTDQDSESLDPREELERALRQRLAAGDDEASALRGDLSRLLQAVGAIDAALSAAEDDERKVLARGLAEMAGVWREFGWILSEVQDVLVEVRAKQVEVLVLQRVQLDLQREQLTKTNLLLSSSEPLGIVAPPVPSQDSEDEPPADVPCPYKGLEAFEPNDAEFFYGREELTATVLARMAEAPFVAVIGPSGSGKSSLVRAGVVPAVWQGALFDSVTWRVVMLTPGERPLEQLAIRVGLFRGIAPGSLLDDLRSDPSHLGLALEQGLADEPADRRILLVLDQFEELFTACRSEDDRRLFCEALLGAIDAADGRVKVIVVLRADFYGRLSAYPQFARAVQDDQILVGPMSKDELGQAIERPATKAGLTLEPGLTRMVLEDVSGEPGALPLMSHALLETWRRRRGTTLTIAAYLEAGGVRGALTRTADVVFDEKFDRRQQVIARRIFMRLTELGQGTEDTRRRVRVEELSGPAEETESVESVLGALTEARLVTAGDDTVEVAHEALIRHWPTLRRWLDEDREGLLIHRQLTDAAAGWLAFDRDAGALYRGARRLAAKEWAERHSSELNPLEREFLDASRAAEEHELEAAQQRARRLRQLVLGLSGLLVVAVVATGFALIQVRRADRERKTAELERRTAESRRLAAQATSNFDRRPDLAALLSLEASRLAMTSEARFAMETVVQRTSGLTGLIGPSNGLIRQIRFAPDGRSFAAVSSPLSSDLIVRRTVRVWSVRTNQPLSAPFRGSPEMQFGRSAGPSTEAAFSRNRAVYGMVSGGAFQLRDVKTGTPVGAAIRRTRGAISLSPDGGTLATFRAHGGSDVWDLHTGRRLARLIGFRKSEVGSYALSRGGRLLMSVGLTGVQVWDVRKRQRVRVRAPARPSFESSRPVALSENGRALASVDARGRVSLWNPLRGRSIGRRVPRVRDASPIALTPDGRVAAALMSNGSVRVWDIATGRPVGDPVAIDSGPRVVDLALSSGGAHLIVETEDGMLRLAAVQGDRFPRRTLDRRAEGYLAFDRGGSSLLTSDFNGHVRVWDPRTRRTRASVRVVDAADATRESVMYAGGRVIATPSYALSPDGRVIAVGTEDGTLRLWSVATRRPTGDPLEQRPRASFDIWNLAFTNDGRLVSATDSGPIRIWDLAARPARWKSLKGSNGVHDVAVSPDGTRLGAAGDAFIEIWDLRTGRGIGRRLPEQQASAIAFQPRGHALAVGSFEGEVHMWDWSTHRRIGQPLRINAGASDITPTFSPDGRTLAVTDESEGTLRLFDAATLRPLAQPLKLQDGRGFSDVAFNPDGLSLATAGVGVGTQLWDRILWTTRREPFVSRLCALVSRNLTRAEFSQFLPDERYHATCPGK